jgi:hypothetical protein
MALLTEHGISYAMGKKWVHRFEIITEPEPQSHVYYAQIFENQFTNEGFKMYLMEPAFSCKLDPIYRVGGE